MVELLQMWALVEVLGIICLPLTVTIFKNLPDRGWACTKGVGIVVLAFCAWLPLMTLQFLPFSQGFICGVLLVLLAFNVVGYVRTRRTIIQVIRTHRIYVITCELIFLGMMFLLGWIRSFGPNIQNFETYMDEGLLASIMRSPHFPPNDMWLSGHSINYYYYAHYTIALLAKLLGQSPSIAFNTGICMLFGLTAVTIFGLTCTIVSQAMHRHCSNESGQASYPHSASLAKRGTAISPLTKALPSGFLSLLIGIILGNLASTQTWLQQHSNLPSLYWFNSSRVIDKTINEFPAFSFLLSDFHAHVLTLAFTILAIAAIFNIFLEQGGGEDNDAQGIRLFGRGWRLFLNLCFMAMVLGGLFTMNGWDFPTYLGLAIVCIALQQWMVHGHFCLKLVQDVFTACASLVALSIFLYAPFYLNFISPAQGIGIVSAENRSPVQQEMLIYGTFMFIFVSFLLINLLRKRSKGAALATSVLTTDPHVASEHASAPEQLAIAQRSQENILADTDGGEKFATMVLSPVLIRPGLIILIALFMLILLKNSLWFAITFLITALGFELALSHLQDRPRAFVLLLGAVAFMLVASTELVYLRDVFADNFPRMNTVFKFYFQAWALLSIMSGAGLYFICTRFYTAAPVTGVRRWVRRFGQGAWSLVCLLLLLAGVIYPIAGAYQRTNGFTQRSNSLDGLTYMQSYNPGDYEAIRWLNSHVQGAPVIVEAFGPQGGGDYTNYARISAFTGLPTLMGWEGHEYQWRVNWLNTTGNAADFYRRGSDVNTIYTSTDSRTVLKLLASYHVRYLYVGSLEVETYAGSDLERFRQFLPIVYFAAGVTIYQVPGSA